jgi:nucleoside-diphosphate-sugar epimerase
MIRLLITGANGFIGRHCLRALPASDIEIHATTSQATVSQSPFAHWHRCNLLTPGSASRLISELRPTHLLHLAWIATPGVYWTSPLNDAWKAASRELVETFIAYGGERMVVAGTCAEYDWSKGLCRESEHSSSAESPYAQAKLSLCRDLTDMAGRQGVSLAWARLFWIYGPYEHPSRLFPSIILRLLAEEPAVCTAGTHRRDYLHVGDVAAALTQLLMSEVTGVVNIASGEAPQIASLASEIAAAMGKTHLLRFRANMSRSAEPSLVVADVTRLKYEVGFRPSRPLHAGIRETIAWWRERCEANGQPVESDDCPSTSRGAYVT